MTDSGFVLLVEAIMEQARKDLNDSNPKVREDAKKYIERMQKDFATA